MKPKLTPEMIKNVEAIRKSQTQEPYLTPIDRSSISVIDLIQELQDYVTELEDRVRVLESNNNRGHR